MKRISPLFIPLFLLLFIDFCGKKGPLLPPVKKIPQNIEVFELSQRGDKVVLEWENPVAYIDGHPLSGIVQVEILIDREGEEFLEWKECWLHNLFVQLMKKVLLQLMLSTLENTLYFVTPHLSLGY